MAQTNTSNMLGAQSTQNSSEMPPSYKQVMYTSNSQGGGPNNTHDYSFAKSNTASYYASSVSKDPHVSNIETHMFSSRIADLKAKEETINTTATQRSVDFPELANSRLVAS